MGFAPPRSGPRQQEHVAGWQRDYSAFDIVEVEQRRQYDHCNSKLYVALAKPTKFD
jgi:hypothetical protein